MISALPTPYRIIFFAILAMLTVALLTACTTRDTTEFQPAAQPRAVQPVSIESQLPKSTFECAAEPNGNTVDEQNEDVADYIIELRESGRDCRRKLKAVGKIIQKPKS